MALNPVTFAAQVNEDFIRYLLTTFPLADDQLRQQLREQLIGRGLAGCPLFKGPYVSLEKAFRKGKHINELVKEGLVHPALAGIAPHPELFAHQERVLRAVLDGRHVLITTGTGSGKTEAFLYPIIDRCLRLRDEGAPPGIVAIIMYPMNALALDQLQRLREMLAGSGITFGMYTSRTPMTDEELRIIRMEPGEKWEKAVRYRDERGRDTDVRPWEERVSEEAMHEEPPRILLTNPYQLEYLITRSRDLPMFAEAPLEFIVVDEAHRYSGALGAEVACLIRRLRALAGKGPDDVVCMGTSATVAGKGAEEEARRFVHRFFGVNPDRIEIVGEEYIEQEWPEKQYLPPKSPPDALPLLDRVVRAIRDEDGEEVLRAAEELTGQQAPAGEDWRERLYELLLRSRFVRELAQVFDQPKELAEGVQQLQQRIGRRTYGASEDDVRQRCEAEALCYLALGAAAQQGENILLRPKLHYFVSGLSGVVATFPPGQARATIFLSEEAARERSGAIEPTAIFPLLVCKTCGQHYFEGFYDQLEFDGKRVKGGTAEGDNLVWLPAPQGSGGRVIFTDMFVSGAEDEEEEELSRGKKAQRAYIEMWICRYCGALHRYEAEECSAPKCRRKQALVKVWVLPLKNGAVEKCPGCGQRGGKYHGRRYEPLKPVRAVEVADVHILAQNMLNAVPDDRQRKLLIFADNRQEAAFQAGWIQDHARRYRLRHLFYQYLRRSGQPLTITDLVEAVAQQLEADRELARALVPEVWERFEGDWRSQAYRNELRYYLRLMVLREVATSFKQRQGLESWGLMRVDYDGLDPDAAVIERWADELGLSPQQVFDGVASLLDLWRRNRLVYDHATRIFSRSWGYGDKEIQLGYIPHLNMPPKGLLLEAPTGRSNSYIQAVISSHGRTGAQEMVTKWGVSAEQAASFLRELWAWLINEAGILVRVDLFSGSGKVLRGGQGLYQIDSTVFKLVAQQERFVCQRCKRIHSRPTPQMICTGWHCDGLLVHEGVPTDDYDVQLLRRDFVMVCAQEHSAQVPGELREEYEQEFKREPPGAVNCLVATPTLELGVDIGTLDMVLMRNVPPTASNYWQRVGRSGRRHRMAVNYTYCQRTSHDRYFFSNPLQLLRGEVGPPRFNLNNEVLVAKHVRAVALSRLLWELGKPANARRLDELRKVWNEAFPVFVKGYLFTPDDAYLQQPKQVEGALRQLVDAFRDELLQSASQAFSQYWPPEAAEQVTEERIRQLIDTMPEDLQRIVDRLFHRMQWALATERRLSMLMHERLLTSSERLLRSRCEAFLKSLSEKSERNYTLRVLSVEGFLPGYGMYQPGIVAFAHRQSYRASKATDFQLSRPDTLAVREFVPGNLIYANGGRFHVVSYRLPAREEKELIEEFWVSPSEGVAQLASTDLGLPVQQAEDSVVLPAIPICDCDIVYRSRIADEEEHRFQLPVTIVGMLLDEHNGGNLYSCGELEIKHMRAQRARLLNIGPAGRASNGQLGYPVCTVCGSAQSPLASESDISKFCTDHEKTCGRRPEWIGFFAEVAVDGLLTHGFEEPADALNFAEGLRMGAESVLEMEREDLQILRLPSREGAAVFVYDPMPGGSGLLEELIARWPEVIDAALRSLRNCPGQCDTSCYACMRTYYNAPWHELLDRRRAAELLRAAKTSLVPQGIIEPRVLSFPEGEPTNPAEQRFLKILQERGFPLPDSQVPVSIPGFGVAIPDFVYSSSLAPQPIAIFIDGLSRDIHGNPRQQQRDAYITARLQAQGWRVVRIPASALNDPRRLESILRQLSAYLAPN